MIGVRSGRIGDADRAHARHLRRDGERGLDSERIVLAGVPRTHCEYRIDLGDLHLAADRGGDDLGRLAEKGREIACSRQVGRHRVKVDVDHGRTRSRRGPDRATVRKSSQLRIQNGSLAPSLLPARRRWAKGGNKARAQSRSARCKHRAERAPYSLLEILELLRGYLFTV